MCVLSAGSAVGAGVAVGDAVGGIVGGVVGGIVGGVVGAALRRMQKAARAKRPAHRGFRPARGRPEAQPESSSAPRSKSAQNVRFNKTASLFFCGFSLLACPKSARRRQEKGGSKKTRRAQSAQKSALEKCSSAPKESWLLKRLRCLPQRSAWGAAGQTVKTIQGCFLPKPLRLI